MTTTAGPRPRHDAATRRDQVIEAAVQEFAVSGYAAASTAAIARRAGISQPYIYALFPSKLDLFLAVHDRVIGMIRQNFRDAARGAATPDEALQRMGMTYPELIADRYHLLVQLQAYAAAGDAEIREHVAREFKRLFDDVTLLSGATPARVAGFFAAGMLANVTTILGLPEVCMPLWGDDEAC